MEDLSWVLSELQRQILHDEPPLSQMEARKVARVAEVLHDLSGTSDNAGPIVEENTTEISSMGKEYGGGSVWNSKDAEINRVRQELRRFNERRFPLSPRQPWMPKPHNTDASFLSTWSPSSKSRAVRS
jgi:hypothetical protein